MHAAQELAGIPYSWGDQGEGVRLVLGTDVTGLDSSVAQSEEIVNGIRFTADFNQGTQTKWLVPASPESFLPGECQYTPGYGQYSTNLCGALQGTLNSSTFAFQNVKSYPLNYPSYLWRPATSSVWNLGLRGMMGPDDGPEEIKGSKYTFVSRMESGDPDRGAVPFRGVKRRQWVSLFFNKEENRSPAMTLNCLPHSLSSLFYTIFKKLVGL